MSVPQFADGQIPSAELQINEWIRQTSEIYGGFHGSNAVDMTHDSPAFDDTYIAAYIKHADDWTLVVPTSASLASSIVVTASGVTLTSTGSTQDTDTGIWFHDYTVPVGIGHGDKYKVIVTSSSTVDMYSPYEVKESVDFPTLDPFTANAIPKDYREWNKVSNTIDILSDAVGLNAYGFLATKKTIDYPSDENTHYEGAVVHGATHLLWNFQVKTTWHNHPRGDECNYWWYDNCCDWDKNPCWCKHDYADNQPCHQAGETDAWSTFAFKLQVEVPGSGTWTNIMSYNSLILAAQLGGDAEDRYECTVETTAFLEAGDYLEGKLVTNVDTGTKVITIDPTGDPFGVKQIHDKMNSDITNTTEKVRYDEEHWTLRELQGKTALPTITAGDIYKVRIQTYDETHEGSDGDATLLIGFIGEVPGTSSVSGSWNGMERWTCDDNVNGSGDKSLANIITNLEYLKGFDVLNHSSQKLRDNDAYHHDSMVFYRQRRFLSYYNEKIGDEEFEPTISYYNQSQGEWIEDSLNTESDTWHYLDLNTVEGLYPGGFYTLRGLSYALESGEGT